MDLKQFFTVLGSTLGAGVLGIAVGLFLYQQDKNQCDVDNMTDSLGRFECIGELTPADERAEKLAGLFGLIGLAGGGFVAFVKNED